jgi:hypothetical protein
MADDAARRASAVDTARANESTLGAPARGSLRHPVAWALAALVLVTAVVGFAYWRDTWPRGESALSRALDPLIKQAGTDQSIVAATILESYREARTNASRWSGVYWGFSFLAATLSALAGLILKLEFILRDQKVKNDIAAAFAVTAAVLISISVSGDFHRKWQANRIAAAELERIAYDFLENGGANARSYFSAVGNVLHARHIDIVGKTDSQNVPAARKGTPKQ